ncbi:CvfB family protein [Pseudobutyrivibrio sp.]|uniref:CvfB family protein n=1 Tax=Pseudobutyrivibrio sp. TaxID=2014367 RepID=UPI001B0A42C1|nr:S1-like domain-containing RNA-binding protein [Pseudobutyrivibrio sp.]MBO5616999.1 RNA-binding protein [Pseudobutyrivibrio sp.]MBP3261619.1 RNA-binding protein [Pseudobutyrivibrio sp.]
MRLGEIQKLKIQKKVEFGVYLTDGEERVLLPKKQVPENAAIADEISVFVYKDSKDRLIATTAKPLLTLGQMGVLTVSQVNKVGAFLDWGLEKDLFLPFKEMTRQPSEGDEILVRVYIDKSERLCASMKGIYDMLSKKPPYQVGDEVEARIYEFGHDFGTFVALEDKYSAMIPRHEDVTKFRIGDVLMVRITGIKEDGKCDVTIRDKAYIQMEDDAQAILDLIDSYAGVLPFSEKASPEVIKRETGLSKAAFKRAIGRLYKERKITLNEGKIRKARE